MKNKTVVLKCGRFDHNWIVDKAVSMWFDQETIDQQIVITPEQKRSVRYNRVFYIDRVSGIREYYDDYFLDSVQFLDKLPDKRKWVPRMPS